MRMPWGRLINAALNEGLGPEDALIAVLRAARTIEEMEGEPASDLDRLSARELEVLTVLGNHRDFAGAAAQMGLSMHTLRAYTKRARGKLGVQKTRDAVAMVRAA